MFERRRRLPRQRQRARQIRAGTGRNQAEGEPVVRTAPQYRVDRKMHRAIAPNDDQAFEIRYSGEECIESTARALAIGRQDYAIHRQVRWPQDGISSLERTPYTRGSSATGCGVDEYGGTLHRVLGQEHEKVLPRSATVPTLSLGALVRP